MLPTQGRGLAAPLLLLVAALVCVIPGSLQAHPDPSSLTVGPGVLSGKGSTRGSRSGKSFTPAGKRDIDAANAARNDGTNTCEKCGVEVVPGKKSESGVSPPSNQRERDHIVPKSKGGDGTPANGQVLCRECNLEKSNKAP